MVVKIAPSRHSISFLGEQYIVFGPSAVVILYSIHSEPKSSLTDSHIRNNCGALGTTKMLLQSQVTRCLLRWLFHVVLRNLCWGLSRMKYYRSAAPFDFTPCVRLYVVIKDCFYYRSSVFPKSVNTLLIEIQLDGVACVDESFLALFEYVQLGR